MGLDVEETSTIRREVTEGLRDEARCETAAGEYEHRAFSTTAMSS